VNVYQAFCVFQAVSGMKEYETGCQVLLTDIIKDGSEREGKYVSDD